MKPAVRPWAAVAGLVLGAAIAGPAAFGGCELDLSSREAMVKTSGKCHGFYAEDGGFGKKQPAPKRVAIGTFQIRFDLETQEYGSIHVGPWVTIDGTKTNFFELPLADYEQLTDVLYDSFVETLRGAGIDVATVEQVKATELWKTIEADDEPKYRPGELVRTTAYGLPNFKMRGMSQAQNKLAGLNKELGTDAVLTVYGTLGLAQLKKGGVQLMLGSLKKSYVGLPALDVAVLGGFREGKLPGGKLVYQPKIQAAFGARANPPSYLLYSEAVRPLVKRGLFTGPQYGEDVGAYVDGVTTLFTIASELGLAHWAAATGG